MIRKLLINGSGSAGQNHLSIAKKLFPNAEIATYTSRKSPARAKSTLHFTEIQEALDFHPEIAVIAGAASSRMDICLALAKQGVHLLIEKPISDHSQTVNSLIEICDEHNTILAVGYNLQFDESLRFFRDKIQSLKLGTPLLIQSRVGQYLPSWRADSDYESSVSARSKLGGGVLLELSHEINYLEWIFGSIDWARATVMRQSSLKIDVEDSAILTFGIKNSTNLNLVASLNMDFVRHDHVRECVVVGELGSLKWDGIKHEVSVFERNAKNWRVLFTSMKSVADTYTDEWRDFLHCVETGNSPQVTGLDGLKTLQVIEAIRLSAPTGQQTRVDRN
jgi:predicted dehydrogenase